MKRNLVLLTPTLALVALAGISCGNSLSIPYCQTAIGEGVSSTFADNFNCSQISLSGTNYVFQSNNLPDHKSYYYGQGSELFEALPAGNTPAGNNKISSQNLKYTIPKTPALNSNPLKSTLGGLIAAGITTNGLAIFNNAAAPPDNLSTEAGTFDNYGGHPQNQGVYHHHAYVTNLSSNMQDSTLIGVALDGYLVYAEYCDNGTATTADDYKPTANTQLATGNAATDSVTQDGTQNSLDRLHGHTTKTRHLATPTYHYHYMQDPTATIKTLLGGYFRGVTGSVSN